MYRDGDDVMKLVMPTLNYKDKAIEFIKEFYQYGSEINGSGALDWYLENSSYEAWIEKVYSDIDVANIEEPRVPALTYFYVSENDGIIGMINLRLALNDFLKKEGGHIGYCIRPAERGNNYATDMLKAALKVYDVFGVREVLLSCDKSNEASSKVIKKCGGVLQDEFYSDIFKSEIQMYLISKEK